MPSSKPTRTEADDLVAATKVVSSIVVWRAEPTGWRLQARVLATEKRELLELRGYIGRTNYSFALLYGNIPIRRYTKHYMHRVGKQIFLEPHKHIWDERTEDVEAYIPSDIDPKADVNDQFISFCQECNIDLVGGYQRINYQFH